MPRSLRSVASAPKSGAEEKLATPVGMTVWVFCGYVQKRRYRQGVGDYKPQEIERKWQKRWAEHRVFETEAEIESQQSTVDSLQPRAKRKDRTRRGVPPVFWERVRKAQGRQEIGVLRKMKECANNRKERESRLGIERRERENVGAPTF